MQANTIAGGAGGLAFVLSQLLFMPAEMLTWQRVAAVVAVCFVGACLAAVGYFSRGIHPVPAEPAAGPPAAPPAAADADRAVIDRFRATMARESTTTAPPAVEAPKVQP